MKFISSILLFVAPIVLALPTSTIETRQSCDVQCGNNCYSNDQINNALNAGYNDYSNGEEAGSSTYPHQYNNYEGFSFPVDGPYQEFPLLENGVYNGGRPGADRIIFNTQGQLAGEVTHTGASGNDFVACSGWQ